MMYWNQSIWIDRNFPESRVISYETALHAILLRDCRMDMMTLLAICVGNSPVIGEYPTQSQ